ncbi:MAG: alanine--tRNA ligase [Pseudomonadota bacterium]|nr:alanine--tRNA ligase [Pseudomonadota bacterium]
MSSPALRRAFLDYFRGREHAIVPSGPLVPQNDPTLLFTNAGMVQFKDVFLGREQRPYRRAASSQCCVRAGGKHNDLENVGYTARHHTFFEMLGNFSFGDYFKREAIAYAWEFLTGALGLDPGRLWVTVFEDDDEAAAVWLKDLQVDPQRFSRCGEKDNFWTMGPTGPCGPCSEIFYDHGPAIPGGPPGSPVQEGDRYVEVWNLVFTQYDRDEAGRLHPIPRPSVDTGMGLERIAAVMQGVHSNYDIDVFRTLIGAVSEMAGEGGPNARTSLQVIADHIRSCAFIAAEGVVPANEGRGYVLRRIIRRAVRHGSALGIAGPFFHKLVAPLAREMGETYPILVTAQGNIERVLRQEEERFAETLEQGLKVLERVITGLHGAGLRGKVIPGREVFQLYDTYGFPVDLTADIARERGLRLDLDGFEGEMARQRERARAASQFGAGASGIILPVFGGAATTRTPGEFTGHAGTRGEGQVLCLYRDGEAVEALDAGQDGVVVLDRTPFYAESGGQIGDVGELHGPAGTFRVTDTQKQAGLHLHIGSVRSGQLALGETLRAEVDPLARRATAQNHSATHLLHAALRCSLGGHVLQKGSLVAPDRLRFDFSHSAPLSGAEVRAIEHLVNAEIRGNREVETEVMPVKRALESGALALFGEKYDAEVRVLRMGDFSVELCGGTHVARTGDIGLFKVIAEGGVAAGVRRIEALTGAAALRFVEETEAELERIASLLKAPREGIGGRIEQLLQRLKQEEKLSQGLRAKLSQRSGQDLSGQAREIAGAKVLASTLEEADAGALRETMDKLKDKLGSAAIVLASVKEGKVVLVAGVTPDLCGKVPAGELVNFVARQVGGKGGGRADLAQAGGQDPGQLPRALESVADWVGQRLRA